jgi:small-conductance mechanosensitive channel
VKKRKPTRTAKKPPLGKLSGVWSYNWYDLQDQLTRIEQTVKKIQTTTAQTLTLVTQMTVTLDAITAEVTRNTTVTASVLQLVQNLVAQIAAIPPSSDPTTQAALDALKATLATNDDAIAAAVSANTPQQSRKG